MKTRWLVVIFLISCAKGFGTNIEKSIIAYGAKADAATNNAAFIQKAIDDVSAAGGGKVIVPPGIFMTGSLILKSGVDLHLEQESCHPGVFTFAMQRAFK